MPSGPRKRRAARRKEKMQSVVTLLPSDGPIDAGQQEDLIPHESTESDCQSPPYSSAPSSPYVESRPSRSSNEWFGSDAVDNVLESSTNNLKEAGFMQEDEQEVALAAKEVSLLPTVTSDAISELFAQSEKDDRNSVEQSSVCVEKIISVQEERNQMTEVVIAVKEVALLSSDAPEAKSDEFTESKNEVKQPSEESIISIQEITTLPEENSQITEVATNVHEKTSGDQGLKGAHVRDVNGVLKQDGEIREACQVAGGGKALPATEVLPHVPLVVNHTKWWNCCGLLDCIMGHDR
ncbi:uncharacterized protein LOC122028023 [Zingiber officinale]|uniref:uncharacterized protein LOC122028023 n=1 Tax=Zingiber officinale TaxID=94328 RepID=UPI001C4C2BBD|nr:uncharacterized protein LOC122028023 [Zingiber officinale]XP_042442976.1 uncharacterized protein LOC122028023 [Zingiber officinale]XP_042442977.1 uncharacterized protein LOC122028023 [Zingiber officinale]XP_042442978.1 uncharacterized protein LOC122028023 [Zingiber officinale]XP_042442979.1 uncharacterized protein LOC122028023 [Zingiber officinale]XP_042442980.1 uncharacterized protein LOC122028023 [Zingiber officinale]XP_042442981.1 uncharacterized protein LOC122028023 [Zingiber officinal